LPFWRGGVWKGGKYMRSGAVAQSLAEAPGGVYARGQAGTDGPGWIMPRGEIREPEVAGSQCNPDA